MRTTDSMTFSPTKTRVSTPWRKRARNAARVVGEAVDPVCFRHVVLLKRFVSDLPARPPLHRQQRVIGECLHRGIDPGLEAEAHDGAVPGVELGGLAGHEVALHRGGSIGRHRLVELPQLALVVRRNRMAAARADRDAFVHGAIDQRMRFRQAAQHAHRAARQRAEPGPGAHREELLPQLGADVGARLGLRPRLLKRSAQRLDPRREAATELADLDVGAGIEVTDDARRLDQTEDLGQAAQHVLGADDRGERVGCLDAVEERHDQGVGLEHRLHGARRVRHLPGLHGDDDDVDRSDRFGIAGRGDLLQMQVAERAEYLEAVLTHRLELRAARDERDLVASLGQARTVIPAEPACADDCKSHCFDPSLRGASV